MASVTLRVGTWLVITVLLFASVAVAVAAPEGQLTWGVHTTLVPSYFDPAETIIGTSFMVLYGLHDALVKPLPGKGVAPALAESWTVSADGLVYDFVLRKGARFHNGEPVTAEDAKFSWERYRGIHTKTLKERVAALETPDAGRVRFRLKQPWPDFLTYFGTVTTSAAWVVPKKYVEKVGDEGFKKAPVGAGPYRFVSFTPGIELVLEAFDGYWRKPPAVKRLVLRVIPDPSTRLVALKRGEVDIAFSMIGELADDVRRTPGLALKPVYPSTHWLSFPDQWDAEIALARPPCAARPPITRSTGRRSMRPAPAGSRGSPTASWPARASSSGRRRPMRSIRRGPSGCWPRPAIPNGFDAGEYSCDLTSADAAEVVIGLSAGGRHPGPPPAAGARRLQQEPRRPQAPQPRADHRRRGRQRGHPAGKRTLASDGIFASGGSPDLDGLLREQATERDRARREAILKNIQQLVNERALFAPLYDLAFVNGVGARVEESGLGLIAGYAFSAPYEDVKLKAR